MVEQIGRIKELRATQVNLGLMCLEGAGVEKDAHKAVELFQKAANQGNAHAEACLGKCYAKGGGVPKMLRKRSEWFKKGGISTFS